MKCRYFNIQASRQIPRIVAGSDGAGKTM
jgi:hypothetical protein